MKKSDLTSVSLLAVPMERVLAVIIGVLLVLVAMSPGHTANYTYTILDYPGASDTEAWGINNTGTIVGLYDSLGFALRGTTWTPIAYPDAMNTWTHPHGINNTGTIIGSYASSNGDNYGFSMEGTTYTRLDPFFAVHTFPYDINDAGTIVGWCQSPTQSFSLSGTTATPLIYPEGSFHAHGINNDGTIVGGCYDLSGTHGCSLNGTTWTTLDYPGATSTYAWGINNSGTIVGNYEDTDGNTHGFSFDSTTWTTLDYPGATYTEAHGINDKGMIVGIHGDATGTHGFLATPPPILTVILEGVNSGLVMSNPSGISCEPDCSERFSAGTLVTITATLYPGSAFSYWSGGCSGTINTCTLVMTEDATVTAHFVSDETKEFKLSVGKKRINKGDGLVQSDDETISCGDTCTGLYYPNAPITLRATPSPGSLFEGWSPTSFNCGTSPTCSFTMDTKHSVKAIFRGPYRLLTKVKTKNSGSGSVTSDISGIGTGINCPASSCEDYYPYGNNVVLTAQPGIGSQFIGWKPSSLGCGANLSCTVPMTKKQTVTATFEGM